jgi:thiamine biosynthesis lipoprotein
MSAEYDLSFHSMGSDVRLLIGAPLRASAPPPTAAGWRERAYVEDFAARLSRFRAGSELCALNDDPRTVVPCSPLLRTAVRAGLWAAERSGGLVDPTLVGALERAGYAASRDGTTPASLRQALAVAPRRRPARSNPARPWRRIAVDDAAGVVRQHGGRTRDRKDHSDHGGVRWRTYQ